MFRAPMPTFAGGEVSAKVAARYDTAKYQTALERARNVLILPEGGVYNRPGFEFGYRAIDYTKLSVLVEFFFSVDQSYALEFSEGVMRVYSGGSPVIRPKLEITGILAGSPTTVTAVAHGYEAGWEVQFTGVEGMVEINGMIGRVVSVFDADTFDVDIDSTGFSAFTGDTGGVAGDSLGGEGGYPAVLPTAPPGVPDTGTTPPGLEGKFGP